MTENKRLLVKIILPSKVILEMEADMVNIPTKEGVVGILPNHSKLTSNIDIGTISMFFRDDETKYFIYNGVAQVTGDEVNIITEFAVNIADIDRSLINGKINNLKNTLSKLEEETFEFEILSDQLKKHQSMLSMV